MIQNTDYSGRFSRKEIEILKAGIERALYEEDCSPKVEVRRLRMSLVLTLALSPFLTGDDEI